MKSRKRSKWLWILVVLVCGLGIAGAVSAFSGGVPVETAPVRRGEIRQFVDERAVTRLPETYLITMPMAARIDAVVEEDAAGRPLRQLKDWTEGTPVKAGQVVARIKPSDLQLAVDRARAAYQALEARVEENADNSVENTARRQTEEFVKSMNATVAAAEGRMTAGAAKAEYARVIAEDAQQTHARGATSKENLLLAQLRQTEAEVDYRQDRLVHEAMVALQKATYLMPTMVQQYIDRKRLTGKALLKQKAEAKAILEQVEQDQQRGVLRSPVDGVILQRFVTNERFLPAGQSLLEIGRLEDLEVEADVLSLDVVDAKVGCPVEIYGPAIGTPPAHGTVERIFPAGFTKVSSLGVEQQRVKVIIRFDQEELKRLLAQRGLGVGYRVRVRIFTAEKAATLTIPRSALFRGAAGQWQVYAVRGGRAQLQDVGVGLINDEAVEVLSGLSTQDEVILAPESTLSDGTRVQPSPALRQNDTPARTGNARM